jgi:L-alanine-DL-glutamate epimerase-like enolase superfamily enzyme
VRLTIRPVALRLARSLRSSYGIVSERDLLAITLTDEDGLTGCGEAAPLEPYDGVGLERVELALGRYAAVLAGSEATDTAQLIEACREVDETPAALAAVDLALWDLAGKRAGKPVAELLSESPAREVKVNATLTAGDRQALARQAASAVAEGFECLKLKVGTNDDDGRVAAVRAAAGQRSALRLDANGAWSVTEAVRAIEALAPAGIELVEEPTHGLAAIGQIREQVSTPIAIDETAGVPGAPGSGVADAVCLKISRCGGISSLIVAASLVRSSGAELYLASTLDGPLGIAAALHAAAALASRGPLLACGLATLGLFAGFENPLPARGGRITLPTAPGLGVAPAPEGRTA